MNNGGSVRHVNLLISIMINNVNLNKIELVALEVSSV